MNKLILFSFLFLSLTAIGSEKIRLKAAELFNQGKYSESLKQWKILVTRFPQDEVIHFNTGLAYFYSGKFQESLNHFKKVAEGSKGLRIPALYWMSKNYSRLDQNIAAVTTIGIALQEENIPLGIYHQLLDLVEKYAPMEIEFKERAEEEEVNEDRLHLALQFYRLAWILNPNDEYQEKLFDMYLKLGDEDQALRLFKMIKSETVKNRLVKNLKNNRQSKSEEKFRQEHTGWRPKPIEFGFKTRFISDSNPRTAVRSTEVEMDKTERYIAELDFGWNYARRNDQINQFRFQFLGDQINKDTESRFFEYKISFPYRSLTKSSEGVVIPSYSDSRYGHFSYQRFYSLDAHYTKFFRRYRTMFGLAYRKANAASLKLDHQDGDIYEAEVGVGRTTERSNIRAKISYRIDNMVDLPGMSWGGDMKALEINLSRKVLWGFIVHGNYRISESRFDATSSGQRKDLLQRFEAELERPMFKLFGVKLFYRYEDNRADGTPNNEFTYDRHLLGVELAGRIE